MEMAISIEMPQVNFIKDFVYDGYFIAFLIKRGILVKNFKLEILPELVVVNNKISLKIQVETNKSEVVNTIQTYGIGNLYVEIVNDYFNLDYGNSAKNYVKINVSQHDNALTLEDENAKVAYVNVEIYFCVNLTCHILTVEHCFT